MHSSELTTGRTFAARFDAGESFFPALENPCRENGIRCGYIPMFLAAFAEADIVGICDLGGCRLRRLELRTNSGSYGGLAAAYVRTVKTASGGTAVQVVHSTHYPGTVHDALDRIPGIRQSRYYGA